MKIIITERQYNMLRLQRRLGYVDEHISDLDRDSVCDYWSKDEIREYVDSSMLPEILFCAQWMCTKVLQL